MGEQETILKNLKVLLEYRNQPQPLEINTGVPRPGLPPQPAFPGVA